LPDEDRTRCWWLRAIRDLHIARTNRFICSKTITFEIPPILGKIFLRRTLWIIGKLWAIRAVGSQNHFSRSKIIGQPNIFTAEVGLIGLPAVIFTLHLQRVSRYNENIVKIWTSAGTWKQSITVHEVYIWLKRSNFTQSDVLLNAIYCRKSFKYFKRRVNGAQMWHTHTHKLSAVSVALT
jgi:hypothetical protein